MSNRSTQRRSALVLAVALPAAASMIGLASPALAATPHGRGALGQAAPSWATGHSFVRTLPAANAVSGRVYLAARNPTALAAAVKAVSTPGSASYHQFVSPGTYLQTYGPSNKQIASVRSYLRSVGLRSDISADHRYLTFSGTSKLASTAFGTKLGLYKKDGTLHQASTSLSLPTALAGMVTGVTGLSEATDHATPKAAPPAVFHNGRPCSRYYGQLQADDQADGTTPLPTYQGTTLPYAVCGYIPSQLRGAYGVTSSGLSGKGATVAVVDAYAAPTILKDANKYASLHGDPGFTNGQFAQEAPDDFTHQKACGPSGWYGEETLDIEAVHGMAPDAKVLYYGAASCFDSDFTDTLAQVVKENKADVVTNSYGETESGEDGAGVKAYDAVFQQAAMQGITFDFSSGDSGDEVASSGTKQADFPASDPYVTAVGGTALAVNANDGYQFEAGWGTEKYSLSSDGSSYTPVGYLYGAGGGYSTLFNRPSYQQGVVPTNAPAGRAVPDVALDADPTTGMLVGETQTFPDGSTKYDEYRIGGTSLASPLMAGVEANTIQSTGARLGFLNPGLYAKAGTSSFRDVTNAQAGGGNVRVDYVNGFDPSGGLLYSVRTFGQDASLKAVKGWDPVTGVGSPTKTFLTTFGK